MALAALPESKVVSVPDRADIPGALSLATFWIPDIFVSLAGSMLFPDLAYV